MILSILIPTLPERSKLLQRVCEHLGTFNPDEVEILTDHRGREITTGQKRNDLIARAKGSHVSQVDDDDFPQKGYIQSIVDAIKLSNPDCVTFNGWYTENLGPRINFTIRLGEKYEARNGHVYRFPNHLAAIKTEIAKSVKFPHQTIGEDFEWAKIMNDAKQDRGVWVSGKNPRLKTSVHIERDLYYYDYRSVKPIK